MNRIVLNNQNKQILGLGAAIWGVMCVFALIELARGTVDYALYAELVVCPLIVFGIVVAKRGSTK